MKDCEQSKRFLKLNKKKVILSFIAVLLTSLTVVSATYAWLTISRTPIVSNLALNVVAENYLELAPDVDGKPGEWNAVLDLSQYEKNTTSLRTVTWSKARNAFYAAAYGDDGRLSAVDVPLTDERNATVVPNGHKAADEYYLAVKFWVRSSLSSTIGLSEAKEVNDGIAGTGTYVIGNPVWNGAVMQHENGGNGLETAVRLGFKCQTTDLEGNPQGDSKFVIYEPNSDTHVDGNTGYIDTMSIDGTNGLVSAENLIKQTTSTWNETTPVLKSDVVYTLGQFQSPTALFDVSDETYQLVTLYVWLEGQDVDCVNAAAAYETSILANIQFTSLKDEMDTGIRRD